MIGEYFIREVISDKKICDCITKKCECITENCECKRKRCNCEYDIIVTDDDDETVFNEEFIYSHIQDDEEISSILDEYLLKDLCDIIVYDYVNECYIDENGEIERIYTFWPR